MFFFISFLLKFLPCSPPGNARLHFCFFLGAGLFGGLSVVFWFVGFLLCFFLNRPYFSLYGFLRDFYFTFLTHCLFSPKHCSATSQMPFPLYGYGKIWRLSCFSDAASRNFSCSIFSPLNLAGHLRTNISRAGFFQRFLGTQED